MKGVIYLIITFVSGLIVGFMLFGLRVLPKTEWTWSFGEPLEMQGGLLAPVMVISHISDKVYYVTEYKTPSDTIWELTKYYEFHYPNSNEQLQGIWEYETTPLTLNTSDFNYQSMPSYIPEP